MNGETSDGLHASKSVPRASVLGTILFIMYINDVNSNLLSKITKFFNDTKLIHKYDTIYHDIN